MLTLNAILEEIKHVPLDRLEDIYNYVHSLAITNSKEDEKRRDILSYAGIFSDMSEEDYQDFREELKRSRAANFDRDIDI